jgi:cellulose biosynthesis protein BcsQ
LGIPKQEGLLNLLVNESEFSEVLRPVSPSAYEIPGEPIKGALFVLPSSVGTRAIPSVIEDVTLFSARLDELENEIDAIVIDTSPTPSLLHSSIYLATDGLIFRPSASI